MQKKARAVCKPVRQATESEKRAGAELALVRRFRRISTDVDGVRRLSTVFVCVSAASLFMVSAHGHQSGHQTLSEHSFGTK